MHKIYKAFGLAISSEILLSELMESQETPEVFIRIGDVPQSIENPLEQDKDYQFSDKELIFKLKDVADYHLINGTTVTIKIYDYSSLITIKLFLLGSIFAVLLLQRGLIPFHGSAIEKNGKCIIFTGESNVGKSTITAFMLRKGFNFVSDDLMAIFKDENGQLMVAGGYPQQKLWRDSAEMLGMDCNKLNNVILNEDKYAIPIQNRYIADPIPLTEIYEISLQENFQDENVKLDVVEGNKKLKLICKNIFRQEYLQKLIRIKNIIPVCIEIALKIKVTSVQRRKGIIDPNHFTDVIEKHIMKEEFQ